MTYPVDRAPEYYMGTKVPKTLREDWAGSNARWFRIGVHSGIVAEDPQDVSQVFRWYRESLDVAEDIRNWNQEQSTREQFDADEGSVTIDGEEYFAGTTYEDSDGDQWWAYLSGQDVMWARRPDIDLPLVDLIRLFGPLEAL